MKNLKKAVIEIIGPVPPPAGGISIHVRRLYDVLVSNDYNAEIYEDSAFLKNKLGFRIKRFLNRIISGKTSEKKNVDRLRGKEHLHIKYPDNFRKLFYYLVFQKHDQIRIIHYHTKIWKYRAFLSMAGILNRRCRVVFTFHSLRENYEDLSFIEKLYIKVAIKNAARLIAVNGEIKRKLESWGAIKDKISIIPAFIPPVEDGMPLPAEITSFVAGKCPVICANASGIKILDGRDIYGLMDSVVLCAKLKEKYRDIRFVFCLTKTEDAAYFSKLKEKIRELALDENFLFFTGGCEFYKVIKISNLFIRPTATDGDAISVREALYLGVPVVASNVVKRPEGVVTYDPGAKNELSLKALEVLQNEGWASTKSGGDYNAFLPIIGVYESVLDR